MQYKMDLKDKRVTVVGLGKSGLAAAKLLLKQGAEVSVTDCTDSEEVRKNVEKLYDTSKSRLKLQIGRHTEEFINDRDFIVVSPDVKDDSLPIQCAIKNGIPVISEIEIASLLCPCPIVAITGTSGKTTVTTLVGRILSEGKRRVFVCGNIGRPFCDVVGFLSTEDIVVVEVSSFQLERCVTFKPHIAVILNISYNHLDRHKNFNAYIEAKSKLLTNQDKGDFAVLNIDDPIVESLADKFNSNVIWFGMDGNPNMEAAKIVGQIFKIPDGCIHKTLNEFNGLPHRLEYIASIQGVRFINDSKSTTPLSLIWALRNTPGEVILIAGGRDKGMDFGLIRKAICELKTQYTSEQLGLKVRHAILIGEARKKICAALDNIVPVQEADSLKEAVYFAFDIAREGDCVLLSPACASFDMFKDYQERGERFKKIVEGLKSKSLKPVHCKVNSYKL